MSDTKSQVSTAFVGTDKLTPVVQRIEGSLGRLDKAYTSLKAKFTTGLVNRAGARAYDMLEQTFFRIARVLPDLINRGTQWTHTVDRLGDISGMTAAQASELAAVAENVGVSSDGMGRALNSLARSVGRTPEIFERYGIAIKDVNGNLLDSYTIFQNARTRLASMTDGIKRADLAQRIFGRGSLEMMDLVTLSTAAYRKQADEARRSGLIITNAGLAAAEELERVRNRMNQAITGVGTQILVGVAPALNGLITGITRTIQANMANIVRFVTGVINFIAGAIGQFTGLNLSPVIDKTRTAVKSFAEWKRDMGLMPTTAEKAKAGIDGVTSSIDRQVKAIDRQLAAMDRSARKDDARREYQKALADVRSAKRELEDIRGETILASRMSEADAVLARQDKAARMAEASKRVREAQEQAEEVARRNRQTARREALQEQRDALQARAGGAAGGGMGGGIAGVVGVNLKEQYRAYVRSMKEGTKDLKTSLVEGLDDVAKDAQRSGAKVADAIQDALFGEDKQVEVSKGIKMNVRSGGGLIDVLRNVGDALGKLAGLIPGNTDGLVMVAGAIAAWKILNRIPIPSTPVVPGGPGGGPPGSPGGGGRGLLGNIVRGSATGGALTLATDKFRQSKSGIEFAVGAQAQYGLDGEEYGRLVRAGMKGGLEGAQAELEKILKARSHGRPGRGAGFVGAAGRGVAADAAAFARSKRGGVPAPPILPGDLPGAGIGDPAMWFRIGLRPLLGDGSPALRALQAAKAAGEAAAVAGTRTADNTGPISDGKVGVAGIDKTVDIKSKPGAVRVKVDAPTVHVPRGTALDAHSLERSSVARNLLHIAGDIRTMKLKGFPVYVVSKGQNKPPTSSTKP